MQRRPSHRAAPGPTRGLVAAEGRHAEAAVPDGHIAGAIEAPTVWKLEFGPTPTRHVMLRAVVPMAKDAFFAAMQGDPGNQPRRELVVFAAPDVDAGLFAEILPVIRPLTRRLTLHASKNDRALVASRKLHGNAPRAGQGGADMLADPDIDSLDMSALGEDMLAHGYFADASSALVDLATIFRRNIAPAQRCGLAPVAHAGGPATWLYDPGACPDTALLAVLSTMQDAGVETRAAASQTVARMALDPEVRTEVEPVVIKMMSN